jgi:TonB family protein
MFKRARQWESSEIRRRLTQHIAGIRGELAFRDHLTGLFNRRLVSQVLEDWWYDLLAPGEKLSLIMIDLDRFKEVNDTYGHLAGDDVLRAIAEILLKHFRDQDVVARYGGDEFVMVLPGAPASEAAAICERARRAISEHRFISQQEGVPIEVPVSFSIGVACFPEDGRSGTGLLQQADDRLYQEKRQRRAEDRRRGKRRGRMLAAVVASAVISAVAATLWVTRSQPQQSSQVPVTPVPATPRAEPGWSQRESELLAEIAALQQQLEALTSAAQQQPESSASQRRIAALSQEIQRLQQALQARRPSPLAATRVPTRPPPTPTPLPPTPVPSPSLHPSPTAATQLEPTAPAVSEPTPPDVVTAPILKRYPPHGYPEVARKLDKEATVSLRVLVDTTGRVKHVELIGKPAGFGFDEEAKRAAFRARYEPATRNGTPIAMKTILTINFER